MSAIPVLPFWVAIFLLTSLTSNVLAETMTLRYGQTASTLHSVFSLPIFVAQREGYFAREGLAVTVVPIAGGTDKMIAALHEAKVDLTHVSTPFLIRSALDGSDAIAIAAEFNNPIYSLVAKPEVSTFKDLVGKKIGMAVAADTIALSMRKLLRNNGLSDADYSIKELVGTPARFNCLKQNECDAVPLGQPEDFKAVEMGYHVLGLSTDAAPDFVYTVTAVRKSWARENSEAVVRYLRALAASFRFIRDPANREIVARAIVETTDASEATARNILQLYFEPERNVLPKQGEISIAGIAQVLAFMGEAGTIKAPLPSPELFVDQRFLHAAGVQ